MSFFASQTTTIATVSLTIQAVILALLAAGYYLKKKNRYRQHAIAMTAALILHALGIFRVMIPMFGAIVASATASFSALTVLSLIHGLLGAVSFVLGIFLVASWRFRKTFVGCFKNKVFMLWTTVLWVASLVLGIILYYLLYVATEVAF